MNNILVKQFESLIYDDEYEITSLSNISALLFQSLENISWAGFYLYKDNQLVLGPFQGKPACTTISLKRGVCGKCASTRKTIIVENVHLFEGHIACDEQTNSEIVLPVLINDRLYGVLDIDSKSFNRFSSKDQEFLEQVVSILVEKIKKGMK